MSHHIVSLHTEGFKRIVVATVTPKERVVRITGPNESGKSSLLDSIEAVFRGGHSIPDVPIKKGKSKAVTEIDMGEFILTRRYTEKNDTLTVELPSGARMGKPQNFVNERLSAVSMDPLEFSRAKPKDQFDMIKSLVKVDVDFAALKGKNQKDFEKRTEVNRDAKALQAQADGITLPENVPDEPVSVADLVTKMEQAGTHNTSINAAKADRERLQHEINAAVRTSESYLETVARIKIELTRAEDAVKDQNAFVEELRGKLAAAPALAEPIDTSAIQTEVHAAGVLNRWVAEKHRKVDLRTRAAAKEKEAEELTAAILARDKERQDAIAAAKMPIPDISFGDEVILYKGVPLEQASTANKIKISAAIAMAMQPDIRVMLIREGSLLDSKALAVIGELAEQYDYQVWIESVDESGKIGFVMEEGRVAGSDEEPEEEKAKPAKDEPKGPLL